MQDKIKSLRVSIDGLAQLTKELKPYRNSDTTATWELPEINENTGEPYNFIWGSTGFVRVKKSGSIFRGVGDNNLYYKWNAIIETQEGTFRMNSSDEPNLDDYGFNFNSKEIDKAIDSLFLAKAWLGKILGIMGTENPYKSGYKTKEDIEPTADVSKMNVDFGIPGEKDAFTGTMKFADWFKNTEEWKEKNHIEKVDYLRTAIQGLIDNTDDFSQDNSEIELEQGFVYKYLSEARFWLGFELERIKNN